jgi:hypothetical protein
VKARVAKRIRWEAKVIRANGDVDDYGTVADSRWGPLRKWWAGRRIRRINQRRGL